MHGYLAPQLVTVEKLFTRCQIIVPDYQRAYAWEEPQWKDLWADIHDGLLSETDHFIGTVVLQQSGDRTADCLGRGIDVFYVVDGQQRLVTLALLAAALFESLRDKPVGRGIWSDFVEDAGMAHLRLGGPNASYFDKIMSGIRDGVSSPDSHRATNQRIKHCISFFREKLAAFSGIPDAPSPEGIVRYVRHQLRLVRFITDDQSLAIKTFQAVNDRGRPLTVLDKTKSLLMFFVNRYLGGDQELFSRVQACFGAVYEHFDETIDLARKHKVEYLTNPRYHFGESELLTFAYHYSARHLIEACGLAHTYAYDLGGERVFDGFLKPSLHALHEQNDALRLFVGDFVEDLAAIAQSLSAIVARVPDRPEYQSLLQRQGLSAAVYPLLVGLNVRDKLDERMLSALSILDLRVYKVRGTDPRAWLYREAVSKARSGVPNEDIYRVVVGFTRWFASDSELDGFLRQPAYRQAYVRFVLWEMANESSLCGSAPDPLLFESCQVDHVLPQDPMIDVATCGFASEEDYLSQINRLGNLCLLEAPLNAGAGNVSLAVKADYYGRSSLEHTRLLGHRLGETGFRRGDIEARTERIIDFFHRRWPVAVCGVSGVPDVDDA
jgi:hypothetical protein